ncbi:MAG: T9SS type A sorting domain-containing protein [Methylovulum sp.]|nr:MAG: T9SS type A sorting domain-containing protein [Methylovulum sp.]
MWYHRGTYNTAQFTTSWNTPQQLPGITTTISADVAASQSRVAIAWCRPRNQAEPSQVDNDVVYCLSEGDGSNWNFNQFNYIVRWRDPNPDLLPNYREANGDTFRAYTDVSLMFDRQNILHAVFTAGLFYRWDLRWQDSVGQQQTYDSSYYVYSAIWHWRSDDTGRITMVANGISPFGGIETNPDPYSLKGRVGAWNRTVHRPNISQDWSSGDLFCTFAAAGWYNDATPAQQQAMLTDTSLVDYYNYDVWVSRSIDGGYHWSRAINITETHTPGAATGACRSEQYPSTASRALGAVHITYLTDYDAGAVVITPTAEGGWTNNDFNYHMVLGYLIPATPLAEYREINWANTSAREISTVGLNDFRLEANYPNPFNTETKICFSLDKPASVKLAVYDITGRQVAELSNGQLSAGRYQSTFNGVGLASGIYFVRLETDKAVRVNKMTLLK